MKKIIITICAVVVCVFGAIIPAGETWADYKSDLDKAEKITKECVQKGKLWRDNEECQKKCVETTLMGEYDEDSGLKLTCDYNGVRIKEKLSIIVDIVSVIVAALGVAAITYVGILYLTAGADVGKAAKAKVRLIEIVIGLVAYASIYMILKFLIPNLK